MKLHPLFKLIFAIFFIAILLEFIYLLYLQKKTEPLNTSTPSTITNVTTTDTNTPLTFAIVSDYPDINISLNEDSLWRFLEETNLAKTFKDKTIYSFDQRQYVPLSHFTFQLVKTPQNFGKLISKTGDKTIEVKSLGINYDQSTYTYTLYLYIDPSLLNKETTEENINRYLLEGIYLIADPQNSSKNPQELIPIDEQIKTLSPPPFTVNKKLLPS